MKGIIILRDTLKLDTETLQEFAFQVRELTPDDKAELITLGAAQLGVEVED